MGFVRAGVVAWDATLSMVATLYQSKESFEKKEYKFSLKEESGGKGKRTLASLQLDLAQYASLEPQSVTGSFALKPQVSMVRAGDIEMTITCHFVRESADDDALTQLSAMSWRTADELAMASSSENGLPPPSQEAYRSELLRESAAYAAGGVETAELAELEMALEVARAEAEAAQDSWASEKEEYERSIRKLKAKLAKEKARAQSLAEEKAEVEDRLHSAQSSTSAAAPTAPEPSSAAGGDLEKYKSLAKQLEKEVNVLEDDLTKIEDENDALVAKCQALMATNKKLKVEAAEAAASLAAKSKRRSTAVSSGVAKADHDAVVQELASSRVQVQELEAKVASFRRRLAATAPGVMRTSSASGEISDLQSRLEDASGRAEASEAAMRELEGALIEAKMAAAEAAFEAETLRGEKRALAKQLAKAKLAYDALSERITEMEVQNL